MSRDTRPLRYALILLVAAMPLMAQDAEPRDPPFSVSGKATFAALASWTLDGGFGADDPLYGSDSSLELAIDVKRPGIRASVAGTASTLVGSAASAAIAGGPGFVAASADGSRALSAALERAYLRWSPGPLVVTVGRQVINWGAAMLWSPADLFAETAIVGLSPERSGTDAVRLAVPIGSLGGIEAVAVPAMDLTSGSYGGRLYGYALGLDFGLEAARDGAALSATVAANVKADLILGLWAEAAWTVEDDGPEAGRLETTVGADYSIGSAMSLAAEYRYDSAGSSSPEEAMARAAAGGSYPGMHYLYASANAKAGDFASLGLAVIADIGNGIAAATLSAALDVAQDAKLTIWCRYASASFAVLGGDDSAAGGAYLSVAF